MSQKDYDELTIFLGKSTAFIGKKLKNGQPAKAKRVLSEQEIMGFVTWYIKSTCEKYGIDDITLNINNVPSFRIGVIKEEGEKEEIKLQPAEE